MKTHLSLISGRIIWLSRSSCCCRSCDEACRWGRRFVLSQFSPSFFGTVSFAPLHSTRTALRMIIESHVSFYDELIYSISEHTIYMLHPRSVLQRHGSDDWCAFSEHLSCIEHLNASHLNDSIECWRKFIFLHINSSHLHIYRALFDSVTENTSLIATIKLH